ncbi:sulfite exporter TauE/SafE family protein [Candidatus Saganbacteria bacterium]|nr:sulfite exporter TauE/SafE family protein [Candidatus Saganbacteria bacterium]
MAVIGLLLIGLAAGTLSGLLGVGGAIIMIPALVYFFKIEQHLAQGTALATLLLPVGILAVWKYWQAGNVNLKFAMIIAIAFVIGGLIGAVIAQPIPDTLMRRIFGVLILFVALQYIFW